MKGKMALRSPNKAANIFFRTKTNPELKNN